MNTDCVPNGKHGYVVHFSRMLRALNSSLLICLRFICLPTNLSAGERLAFSGKIRFEKSAAPGVTAPCNPFTWSDSLLRCSDIWMFTQKAGITEYNRVAMIHTDESAVDNGW
jgi:hypothetical protein